MIRRPRRSTLFPYTPLSRSKNLSGEPKPYRYRTLGQVATLGRHKGIADVMGLNLRGFLGWWVTRTYHLYQLPTLSRSEEHTSELQSQSNLVCRLLLEKQKKT